MNVLGWFLAVVGAVVALAGLFKFLKMKKMNTVPFRRPSEIAQGGPATADAKGMVSTEGQVLPGPQPLIAPMSGQPCLAYEITIERKWEKQVQTQKGVETRSGTDKVHTEYRGAVFQLSDGNGTVAVDASERPDVDMDKAHDSKIPVGMVLPGTLTFGHLQMNTPAIVATDSRTKAFVGTEKILKQSPTLYALGQIGESPFGGPSLKTPKGIGTGKLILSTKGREALVKKTKTQMTVMFALGGLTVVGGSLLGVFGPKSESNRCVSTINDAMAKACDDSVHGTSGETYTWTVATPGTYELKVSPAKGKYPLYADIQVLDAKSEVVAEEHGALRGDEATLKHAFAAGTYKVKVSDHFESEVEGGFSYKMAITSVAGGAPATTPVAENDEAAGAKDTGASKVTVMAAAVAANGKGAVKPTAAKPGAPAAKPGTAPAGAAPAGAAKPAGAAPAGAAAPAGDKAKGAADKPAAPGAAPAKPAEPAKKP